MKKIFLIFCALVALITTNAQTYKGYVGINTATPASTLDVVGSPTDTTVLEGIIAPRLSGDQLQAKTYTAAQTGVLIYVTAASSLPALQAVNVTAPGYYYFDGTLWQRVGNGSGGSGTNNWNVANTTTSATTNTQNIYQMGSVGINTNNPNSTSADLELGSTTKGLLLNRVANTAALAAPVDGLLVYDLSVKCFKGYSNGAWSGCLNAPASSPSTNGTAIVSSYGGAGCVGTGSISGSMQQGVAVSGATMTIYANVTALGSYNITASANGVVFSGSGIFTSLGCQSITLYGSGIPASSGAAVWTTNTSPSTTATSSIALPNASVSGLNCSSTTNTGNLYVNTAASGVSSSIPYTGGNGGTYSSQNIPSTGVTGLTANLSAGTLVNGDGLLIYTITGTPTSSGTANFAISLGGQSCTLSLTVGANLSTNGTGAVTSYGAPTCTAGSISGTLTQGVAVSGVTATIYANVTTLGTYNISTTANGITFSGSGTFSATGCQAITLTASGTPTTSGSTTFTTNTSPSTSVTATVNDPSTNGSGVVTSYGAPTCTAGSISGTLTQGVAVSGVTMTIYANVTTLGSYNISSTANGVTFSGSGTFTATGCQAITLTATGTPTASGNTTFTTNTSPSTNATTVISGLSITGLNCSSPNWYSSTGGTTIMSAGSNYNGYFTLQYGMGNGVPYSAGAAINSTGVTGLTATLRSGVLSTGSGYLYYDVTGIPSGAGIASFNINFGGQNCTVSKTVTAAASITSLTCTPNWNSTDDISVNANYNNYFKLSYSGGNGAAYPAGTAISSTGVTGLTATLRSGVLATGAGTDLIYDVTGTPSAAGTASFTINFGGAAPCTITKTVTVAASITSFTCGSSSWLPNALTVGVPYSGKLTMPVSGGNGASYSAGNPINSTGVTGLTATLVAGDLSSNVLVYNVTGTPSSAGTASFALTFNGASSCTVNRTVTSAATITSLNCGSSTLSPVTLNASTPYTGTLTVGTTGGNGAAYNALPPISSTGVTGLTATLRAGNLTDSANLVYDVTGTPSSTGTANFLLSFGGASCTASKPVVGTPTITGLNCTNATFSPTAYMVQNTAFSGTAVVPYTGGNGITYSAGTAISSTGVTGLTATLQGGTLANGSGMLTYAISGTPTSTGTASFALNFGTQSCTLNATVSYPIGSGTLVGKTCFDVAISNNNANGCGALTSRTAQKADFTLTSTNTQTYTFTPSGTVSNVRFKYVNTNGNVIASISGGNSGNNISTAVTATVNYNNALNGPATGLTNSNPLTADIIVIYNDGPTGNGTDRQLKLTPKVKDCACCGAYIAPGVWKTFLCHNLGADTSANPFDISQSNLWKLSGAMIGWGSRGPNITGNSSVDWQTAPTSGSQNFLAPLTNATSLYPNVSGWTNTINTGGQYAYRTASGAKTANDPCPAGYRLPLTTEMSGIYTNNTYLYVDVGTALTPGNLGVTVVSSAGQTTLTFPNVGHIGFNGTYINAYNQEAYITSGPWWTTPPNYGAQYAFPGSQFAYGAYNWASGPAGPNPSDGGPVRCIEE